MTEHTPVPMTVTGLEDAERVYGIFGVCRSGTTAIEKLLTLGDIPAYHQPIKTCLLRGVATVKLTGHHEQDANPNRVAVKETLGAYDNATSTFNPLEILRSGVSDDQLHTIFTVKEPFYNFLSWAGMIEMAPPKSGRHIGTEELLDYYIASCHTVHMMFEESRDAGIATTVFDYESLKTVSGDISARRLLEELGIDPETYNQRSWSSKGSVRHEQSGIIYSATPSVNALHDRLDASSGLRYFSPNLQQLPAVMHATIARRLTDQGLYDNYAQMAGYGKQ